MKQILKGKSVLSKEAKLLYIQMRIEELKRMQHISYAGIWVGLALTIIGFLPAGLGFFPQITLWIGVFGIIVAAVEFYSYVLNNYQYFKLKDELKAINEPPQPPQ